MRFITFINMNAISVISNRALSELNIMYEIVFNNNINWKGTNSEKVVEQNKCV